MQSCYLECPPNLPGGSTIAHCQHKTIYSTVGADTKKSIPNGCKPQTGKHVVLKDGLCYKLPSKDWHVHSPGFMSKKCPSGTYYNGTGCAYDRGVGVIPKTESRGKGGCCTVFTKHFCGSSRCPKGYWGDQGCMCWKKTCPSNKPFYDAGLCYPKTRPGFKCGATLCTMANPPKSKIGYLPDKCPDNRILNGRLCYPKCPKNYHRKVWKS